MEDRAMEEETFLAMKRFLFNQLADSVADMPTDIMGSDGKTIAQEWDAVLRDGDVLYLCEVKHNIILEQVNKLPERIRKFKQFQVDAQSEFHSAKKLVGV
jgi:putative heme iron utilization protein